MNAEPKDAVPAAKFLHERAYGVPKQELELSGEVSTSDQGAVDWTTVPIERRRQLLEAALELGALGGDGTTEH